MQLTDKERESDLWRKLEAEFKAQLDKVRDDLEKASNTEKQTAVLIGRAKQIRQWLKLSERPAVTPANDSLTGNEYR